VAALLALTATQASAQFSTDARTLGMAGVHMRRTQGLDRYNPAYRSVPDQATPDGVSQAAKLTLPIPFGLIPFLEEHPIGGWADDPLFDPTSPQFNPFELLDIILHPPLFVEIKEVPRPVNDIEFTIGKNELIIDLGATQGMIPADQFGVGTTGRPFDLGAGFKGVRVGVHGWMRYEVIAELGDTLLGFLKEGQPALPNTRYNLLADMTAQTGFAPYVGWSGRVAGDSGRGLFMGAALRYYVGVVYGTSLVNAGFTTGDTIFSTVNGLAPDLTANSAYSPWGNALGTGWGGDVGFVIVNGPLELGVGVTDIGAKITWRETRVERTVYDTVTDAFQTTLQGAGLETQTDLPLGLLANLTYTTGDVALGVNVQDNGRRTVLSIGAEKRFSVLALRGGITRDQRKRLQFGWGAGLRLGPIGLDVGFFTHSSQLSDARGITMATSFSIY
jgi:hypothetical protein